MRRVTRLAATTAAAVLAGTWACDGDTPTPPDEPDICITGLPCDREPDDVTGGLFFKSVSAGGEHACGLALDGAAYCWGSNRNGQLGAGSNEAFSPIPLPVSGGHTFESISSGALHSCAVTAQGNAYCWGNGDHGALGSGLLQETCGTAECSRVPVQVIGGHSFGKIDAGFNHTCAVSFTNLAYCWGANEHGELGTGIYSFGSLLPELVGGPGHYIEVSAGTDFSCGLTLNAAVYCWGSGEWNSLGTIPPDFCPDGPAGARCSAVPLAAETNLTYAHVSAGDKHTCALSSALAIYCWGDNAQGQLGGSGEGDEHLPVGVAIPGGAEITQLSVGESHACAVTTASLAYCWGNNRSGQLGDGSEADNSPVPVQVVGEGYDAITAGGNSISSHSCALRGDRRVACWGSREFGQTGRGGGP